MSEQDKLNEARRSCERLGKWRTIFAGWQLGTRPDSDPEAQAVRDIRDAVSMLRAEVSALAKLLIEERKLFTAVEYTLQVGEEAEALCRMYERKFPGMKATDTGVTMTMPEAAQTMKGWRL